MSTTTTTKNCIRIYAVFLFAFISYPINPAYGQLSSRQCLSNDLRCYHCDSLFDPQCEDPFYYYSRSSSQEGYLTRCYGCCIKIVLPEPTNFGPVRVVRSCSENFPALKYSVQQRCSPWESPVDEQVCLCATEYCNSSNNLLYNFVHLLILSILHFVLLW